MTDEDMLVHVTLTRESGRQLGIKLGNRGNETGIYIMELMIGSIAEQDGRLQAQDRILSINGTDVRFERLAYAFDLIKQSLGHISLIVSRTPYFKSEYDHLFKRPNTNQIVSHSRTKSAPDRLVEMNRNDHAILNNMQKGYDVPDGFDPAISNDRSASCESLGDSNFPHRQNMSRFQSNGSFSHTAQTKYVQCTSIGSFGDIVDGNYGSLMSGLNKSNGSIREDANHSPPALPPRSRQPLGRTPSFDQLDEELNNNTEDGNKNIGGALPASGCADVPDGLVNRNKSRRSRESADVSELTIAIKKSFRLDGNQLPQKTVTISKVSYIVYY